MLKSLKEVTQRGCIFYLYMPPVISDKIVIKWNNGMLFDCGNNIYTDSSGNLARVRLSVDEHGRTFVKIKSLSNDAIDKLSLVNADSEIMELLKYISADSTESVDVEYAMRNIEPDMVYTDFRCGFKAQMGNVIIAAEDIKTCFIEFKLG